MVFVQLFFVSFFLSLVASKEGPQDVPDAQEGLLAGGNFTEEFMQQDDLHNATNSSLPQKQGPPLACIKTFFTDDLPDATREELKAIWADDTFGTNCNRKQAAALKVVQALPKQLRDQAFANRFYIVYQNPHLSEAGRRAAVGRLIEILYGPEKYKEYLKYQTDQDAAVRKFHTATLRLSSQARHALIKDIQELNTLDQNSTIERNVTELELTNETLSEFGTELLIQELQPTPTGPPKKLRCGVPPFKNMLSYQQREEIDTIWANYVDGADCRKERRATQKLINHLPVISQVLYLSLGDYNTPLGAWGR